MKMFAVLTPESAQRIATLEACSVVLHDTTVHFAILERADVDFDRHDAANANAVLVKVQAFSCNYREKGRFLKVARDAAGKGYAVLGSEFAGTVVKIGAAVTDLAPGDRVFGNGSVGEGGDHPGLSTQRGSAELQIHQRSKLLRFPAGMPFAEAAAFSVGAQTAYSMIRRLNPDSQAHIAVTAAGSNTSLFVVKALLARNHKVHALTTSAPLVPALLELGLSGCCLLHKDQDPEPALTSYLAEHGIDKFDAVVDPFMDIYLRKLVRHLKRSGSYITCGVYEQFEEARPDPFVYRGLELGEMFSLIIRKNISLIGNNLGTTGDLEQALADYFEGRLSVSLDSVCGCGTLAAFIERSFLASRRRGKVVFDYGLGSRAGAATAHLERREYSL
jgi:NADPH:quinone reductase-like Zn-dependent oxidoreductase